MKKGYLMTMLAVMMLTACGSKEKEKSTIVRPVKTAIAESRAEIKKDFSGLVEAVDYVKLAFRVSGQIVELPIVEGQRVKKGALIARIDPRELSLQYAADKASYETAKAQIDRNKRLLEKQAISKQDYETSNANYQRAKSAYDLSSNNMKDTRLIAPFDGSIETRLVENFQRVNSGEGIVQLVNTNKLRIKFMLPDSYLYLMKSPKKDFSVEFDTYKGKRFKATLEEFLDISTNGTGIPVSLLIEDSAFDRSKYEVKPGFTCNIRINADISQHVPAGMTLIPLTAIFESTDGSGQYVWVVDNNQVKRRLIKLYTPTGDAQALISEGLKAGEVVVTAGVHQLIEGENVKAIQ